MREKIREARKAAGITQTELAAKLGVTSGAVSQWEKGLTRPEIGKLKQLADALNTTVDDLLTEGSAG
jgi:transcriptional regulator with XRE-family HTH domain